MAELYNKPLGDAVGSWRSPSNRTSKKADGETCLCKSGTERERDRGPDGKPQTVRYLELTAMLLNELQKQNCQLRKESNENQQQERRIEDLTQRMAQQASRIDQQEARNRQLSDEVAQLKGMFELAHTVFRRTASAEK
jgi:hypothetical protein